MLLVGAADGDVGLLALLSLALGTRGSPEDVETERRCFTLELKRLPTLVEPDDTNEGRMSGFQEKYTELLSRGVRQQQEQRFKENDGNEILRCAVSILPIVQSSLVVHSQWSLTSGGWKYVNLSDVTASSTYTEYTYRYSSLDELSI